MKHDELLDSVRGFWAFARAFVMRGGRASVYQDSLRDAGPSARANLPDDVAIAVQQLGLPGEHLYQLSRMIEDTLGGADWDLIEMTKALNSAALVVRQLDQVSDGDRFSKKALASELGVSPRSVLNYAKAAGVKPARRGDRGHKYTAAERLAILKHAASSSEAEIAERAGRLLPRLESKSKDGK